MHMCMQELKHEFSWVFFKNMKLWAPTPCVHSNCFTALWLLPICLSLDTESPGAQRPQHSPWNTVDACKIIVYRASSWALWGDSDKGRSQQRLYSAIKHPSSPFLLLMDFSFSFRLHFPLCGGPGELRPVPSWSWACPGHWLSSLSCNFFSQDVLSPAGQSQLLVTESTDPREKACMAGQDLTSPTVHTGGGSPLQMILLINFRMGYWTVRVIVAWVCSRSARASSGYQPQTDLRKI